MPQVASAQSFTMSRRPDQIDDRMRLDERQTRVLAAGWRRKGHPIDQRRIVLHIVELGEALRCPGQPRIGRYILHPLAVDE